VSHNLFAAPLYIIMELVNGGTLQNFLKKKRNEQSYLAMHGGSGGKVLTARDLTSYALQVTKAMTYLCSKSVIHRDLAARNVLINVEANGETVCKVADFGLARVTSSSDVYERKSEGRLPIRWMAPESLKDNCYTSKSDVWSFGILMWEIVVLGATPYPGKSAADVLHFVCEGGRMEKPPHCHRALYNLMSACWSSSPESRPHFAVLTNHLERLLGEEAEYIHLNMFPQHIYYNQSGLSNERV